MARSLSFTAAFGRLVRLNRVFDGRLQLVMSLLLQNLRVLESVD